MEDFETNEHTDDTAIAEDKIIIEDNAQIESKEIQTRFKDILRVLKKNYELII